MPFIDFIEHVFVSIIKQPPNLKKMKFHVSLHKNIIWKKIIFCIKREECESSSRMEPCVTVLLITTSQLLMCNLFFILS